MFEHVSDSACDNTQWIINVLDSEINNFQTNIKSKNNQLREDIIDILYLKNRVPIYANEKIRIIFLFQIPSVWPSWETVWTAISNDDRFEAKMILYDHVVREISQIQGARDFLIRNNIIFEEADNFDFEKYRPHIIMYQSPWEDTHRPSYLHADHMKKLGIRVAYIPYGIEYSDSVLDYYKFSNINFKAKPWRIYSISEKMKNDHMLYSSQGSDHIVVSGHPKFDAMLFPTLYELSKEYKRLIGKKKIIFWCMHFPIYIEDKLVVPILNEYVNFTEKLNDYQDIFFLVRPHPKFIDDYKKLGYIKETNLFYNNIKNSENACFYFEDDYRPALLHADYVIGDRSALMVEACALNIPVLYLTNYFFTEKMLPSVEPIFDSYYHGSTCYDIELFIEIVVKKGLDYKEKDRIFALKECLPYLDGMCGKRIVNDLANSMYKEILK